MVSSVWRTVVLSLGILLFTLASCRINPEQVVEDRHSCVSSQNKSSCFYREDPTHSKLVIFVHGVFGSKSTTWGNPTSENFWPKMIANDQRFAKDVDIYLVNYRTPYMNEAPNIHETASNELGKLESHRVFTRYKEIHFITHSMGGLVAKSMLIRLNRGEDIQKLRKIASIVYLATPAQGARVAELANWLSLNQQLKDMERASLNTYIQSVEDQWVQLIEDRDKTKGEFPFAFCAYETLKIGSLLIVPRELAFSRCDGPLHPMAFDHFKIAEPTEVGDDPYLWTMAKIVESGSKGTIRKNAAALVEHADTLVFSGKNGEAREAYDAVLKLYGQIDDRQGRASVLTRRGYLESKLGRNDQARTAYTEAMSHFQTVGDRLGEANVLRGLGDLESRLGRNGHAREAYAEARGFFQTEGNRLGEANVLGGLGHLERKLGRNDQARVAYGEARRLFQLDGNRLGEGNVLVGLGELERKLGRHEQARKAYEEARSHFQSVTNRLGEANVLVGLGHLERKLGRGDQARVAYVEAQRLFQAEGNQLGEANVLVGIGHLERKLGRYEQARMAYEGAKSRYQSEGDRLGEANILVGLGELEYALRRYEQARTAYMEAQGFFRVVGDRLGEANVFRGLGRLEREFGRNDQSRAAYEEARKLFQAEGDRLGEANVLTGLGQLEVNLNTDLARQHFHQAALLYEQIGMSDRKEWALNAANSLPLRRKTRP